VADNRPSLAIVIVTFNSRGDIQGCLDSLVGYIEPFPTTITVVDNASTDGTAAFIRQRWPAVKVIDGGGNLGFSRANNLGIRASKSDYVLLMNPDTVAPPGGVQTLVRGLAAYGAAAVAGPRLLNDRNFPELSWGPSISPLGELTQKVLATLYHRKVRRVVRYVDRLSRQSREVAWVSGACMVIRRPDLEAVGDRRVALGGDGEDDAVAGAHLLDVVEHFAVVLVLHGDRDYGHALVDQRDGAVLHLGGGIAFGVDVADFLELERALHGHGVLQAASQEEEVLVIGVALGDGGAGFVQLERLADKLWHAGEVIERGGEHLRLQVAALVAQVTGEQVERNHRADVGLG